VSGSTCLAVMYHYVRDSQTTAFPAIRALPPALFEQQLDWLQRGYHIIGFAELADALRCRASAARSGVEGPALSAVEGLPPDAALLTFDDGFLDHYANVLPILQKRGLSGVFFLAYDSCGPAPRVLGVHKTHLLLARLGADIFAAEVLRECELALAMEGARKSRVFGLDGWEHADERAVKELLNYELPFEEADRILDTLFARHIGDQQAFARQLYLDDTMIMEMARAGMTFGFHTRSHRMLSRLTVAEQQAELRDGVSWIRSLTGQAHVPFCYPWGSPKTYTTDTIDVLEQVGYSMAFNTVRRRIDLSRDRRFELPRVDTRDLPPYTGGEPAERARNPESEA
jgi:peptidoglycan/xylan/chitin deacetylase (PgdA/CDA1 family)